MYESLQSIDLAKSSLQSVFCVAEHSSSPYFNVSHVLHVIAEPMTTCIAENDFSTSTVQLPCKI